jgi:hypothetical protein
VSTAQLPNLVRIVLRARIDEQVSLAVNDTRLNLILVVIQTRKYWYNEHARSLLKGLWVKHSNVTPGATSFFHAYPEPTATLFG